MRLLWIILLCLCFPIASAQQTQKSSDQLLQLYKEVASGQRAIDSLSQEDRQQVLLLHNMMARSCGRLHGKCLAVCEAANSLETAANDLAHCARRHDFSNDCHSRARDVRDAADEYESAVSEASGGCD